MSNIQTHIISGNSYKMVYRNLHAPSPHRGCYKFYKSCQFSVKNNVIWNTQIYYNYTLLATVCSRLKMNGEKQ